MPSYSFAIVTDLREKPVFRFSSGRSFSAPFDLCDGTPARIYVEGRAREDEPCMLRVVNGNQDVIGEAMVASGTSQVFRDLGLLIHVRVST